MVKKGAESIMGGIVLETYADKCIAEGRAEGRAEGIAEGRAEGIAEGRAEGIAEGRAEGRAEGAETEKIKLAKNAIKNGISIQMAADITGLTIDEINKIKNEM